jgi:hypothetical protein
MSVPRARTCVSRSSTFQTSQHAVQVLKGGLQRPTGAVRCTQCLSRCMYILAQFSVFIVCNLLLPRTCLNSLSLSRHDAVEGRLWHRRLHNTAFLSSYSCRKHTPLTPVGDKCLAVRIFLMHQPASHFVIVSMVPWTIVVYIPATWLDREAFAQTRSS